MMPVMAETVCMCGSEFLMCLCPRVTRVRLQRLQQAYTGGMSEREREAAGLAACAGMRTAVALFHCLTAAAARRSCPSSLPLSSSLVMMSERRRRRQRVSCVPCSRAKTNARQARFPFRSPRFVLSLPLSFLSSFPSHPLAPVPLSYFSLLLSPSRSLSPRVSAALAVADGNSKRRERDARRGRGMLIIICSSSKLSHSVSLSLSLSVSSRRRQELRHPAAGCLRSR